MDINVKGFNCKIKLVVYIYFNNSSNLRAIIWLSTDIMLLEYKNILHISEIIKDFQKSPKTAQ